MDFSYPADVEAFRTEVQEFLTEHVTDAVLEEVDTGTVHSDDLHKAMAAKGWLSGAVPTELGGGGMSPLKMSVLIEELQLFRAPIDAMGVAIGMASIILELGNDFLKGEVVPRLLSGDALGAFGYSEPESGSDVAAAQTKAVRDGDEWVINGQKMWTTMAHVADYVILLTRTNPDVPKHKGLTFFIVPLDSPGIEIQPVWTMGYERSNATFYDEVRLDDKWRLGDVDGGWNVMKTALKFERGIAGGQFYSPPLIDATIDWATDAPAPDGGAMIDDPGLRESLVRAMIDVEVCRCFAQKTAYLADTGAPFGVEGSMTKLFASETFKKHSHWFMDAMGPDGLVKRVEGDGPHVAFVEETFRHAPVTTIYGGTSEINRNMVAEAHLGLPRARR